MMQSCYLAPLLRSFPDFSNNNINAYAIQATSSSTLVLTVTNAQTSSTGSSTNDNVVITFSK